MDNKRRTDEELAAISQALSIAGAEGFQDAGVQGQVTVHGDFASAILREQLSSPKGLERLGLVDQPVRISRFSSLEVWCNGFYFSHPGVRGIIHRAARSLDPSGHQR